MKRLIAVLLVAVCAATCAFTSACFKNKKGDISEYNMLVIYEENDEKLTGSVVFDYYNDTETEVADLKFNLYGNAFREGALYSPVSETYESKAYYGGKSYGGMEITNVENCSGWNVGGEDENILTVNLITPVAPASRAQLTITYTLNLAKINHRTGVSEGGINLGNFYPVLCAYSGEGFVECPYYTCGDPFVSECANYTVTVDMPSTYTAATSGKLDSEAETNGRKKCTYSLNNARDFAMVLSDKFEVKTGDVDGITVSYYYTEDANPDLSLTAATESLKYFSDTFGKYAYPTLSVVQTGFCYGGMEYPALTMIAKGLNEENKNYTIVHENAHQWWYAMVGSDQINCAWQDEGLAEYSTLMFFEQKPNYGFTRTGIVKSATNAYRAYFTVYNQLNDKVNTAMTRHLKDFSGEFEYNNITYNKGLLLFETLRNSIGDEKFTNCLKNYFSENCGKIATCDDLISCFAKSGTDLKGLFASFIDGKIII